MLKQHIQNNSVICGDLEIQQHSVQVIWTVMVAHSKTKPIVDSVGTVRCTVFRSLFLCRASHNAALQELQVMQELMQTNEKWL